MSFAGHVLDMIALTIIIAIVLGILFFKSAFGQGIVSDANSWNVRVNDWIAGTYDTETWSFGEDTLINGYTCKMIEASYYGTGGYFEGGYLREESDIVYYIHPDGFNGTLYDFNMDIGDSCSIILYECPDIPIMVYVTYIDTIENLGIQRKRWTITDGASNFDYWIEGVGSKNGPIHTLQDRCVPAYLSWELACFKHNDTTRPGLSSKFGVGSLELIRF